MTIKDTCSATKARSWPTSLACAAAEGVPFTEAAVTRMLEHEPMASPGAAFLALAWQHRRVLDF